MYKIAKQVGSVFQNPRTQFFNTDTDSEIAFGIENSALPIAELHKRVAQAEKDLDIEDLSNRSIFELSGGEKQKIAFASVYAMNPDIYLLDEPSSNLDMEAIDALKETLKSLKQQGKTILVAEHRLYYLMDVIDRAFYFEYGRLEKIYTPKELLTLPQTTREKLGLRVTDLRTVDATCPPVHPHKTELELRNADGKQAICYNTYNLFVRLPEQEVPMKQPGKMTAYFSCAANIQTDLHLDNQMHRLCYTAVEGGDGK